MNKNLLSIILPTYNEAENIVPLINNIMDVMEKQKGPFEIIVIDDNSPDNTASKVKDEINDKRVKLYIRHKDRGLAKSVREGIEKSSGNLVLIMDTDFNHNPAYIPKMLDALTGYNLVIGSRYVKGGGMPISKIRYFISLFSNLFLRIVLALPYHDTLSGFLLFRREILNNLDRDKIFQGYGDYSIRLLSWTKHKTFKFKEIPVIYEERSGGKSKTNLFKVAIKYFITALDVLNAK